MAEFRKVGFRMFVKVEGNIVIKVLNMEKRAAVEICDSAMMAFAFISDKDEFPPCTEEEFNVAYKDALAVIQMQKI